MVKKRVLSGPVNALDAKNHFFLNLNLFLPYLSFSLKLGLLTVSTALLHQPHHQPQ